MKTIKTTLAALLLIAGTLVTASTQAAPLVVQPVVTPPQPTRIAPMVLPTDAAIAIIAQIKAENNTVSLNGATVSVFPPSAILITEGADAGKVRVNIMVRPAPHPSPIQ